MAGSNNGYTGISSIGHQQMKDPVQDTFERCKRAADIIQSMLDDPGQSFIRKAESSGCLTEFEILLEDSRLMLKDEVFLDDLAWNLVHESKAC